MCPKYFIPQIYPDVNLKPVVPGHVLVIPKRLVARFKDLSSEEVSDLWLTAQKIGTGIERHYHATAMSFIIQDGPGSGQTIHHVHIHIIPRIDGDFVPSDEIYREIEKERQARTEDQMAEESKLFASLFTPNEETQ